MRPVAFVFFVVLTWVHLTDAFKPRYQHFEDYLSNLDEEEKNLITKEEPNNNNRNNSKNNSSDDGDDDADEDDNDDDDDPTPTTPPLWAGLKQKKKDITCCMLGQLAGDKGYHCFSKYYVARLIMRNMNRAHNRKMSFYGREKIPNYGDKVMRTFQQCVAGYSNIFHKCCHLAAMEVRPRRYDTQHHSQYLAQQSNNRLPDSKKAT